MSDLDRLAERLGIEPFYHDIWGNRRETSDATKRALAAAMGYPAGSGEELAASLHAVEDRAWRRMLPPVLVIDEGASLSLALAVCSYGVLAWCLAAATLRAWRGWQVRRAARRLRSASNSRTPSGRRNTA